MTPAPFALPWALDRALREAYSVPARAYHHFGHVIDLLWYYARIQAGLRDPNSVALAILFHDAIYEPGRSDNEQRSAALARVLIPEHLPKLEVDLDRVEALIMMTAAHGTLEADDVDEDARLFLDIDMAILGAERARYDAYERAIAEEYAMLDPRVYETGRARFLQNLLARRVIYLSEAFRIHYELKARDNLRRALTRLGG